MNRCVELAAMGAGYVAPNPMVGAVLVYEDRIIGEGYHRKYGQAHAEVNCINSVAEPDLISKSTLYVSLEPCVHFGKTPPCTDLVIKHKIPRVVIGCRDSFDAVDGRGIEKLRSAGIDVTVNVLEDECRELNKRFFTFHEKKRPYIILKWAETADKMIGSGNAERLMISNEITNKLVHKWRSEEAAILAGTNTALMDDPALTTRNWPGNSPIRIVIDRKLSLPPDLKLFDGSVPTIVFNCVKQDESANVKYVKLKSEDNLLPELLQQLYESNIQSVLVEGGSKLLQSFINNNLWDEARVIMNTVLRTGTGIAAPVMNDPVIATEQQIQNDHISFFRNKP